MSAKKSRFDGLDVAAMASHLKRTAIGFKLANVYDGSALGVGGTSGGGGSSDAARGVYVFKLADPSGGSSGASSAGSVASGEVGGGEDPAAEGEVEVTVAAAQDQKRAMLLVESGVRFHPTT